MNQQDLNQIAARGISEQQIEHQLEQIKNGFPFLKLEGAAAIGKGYHGSYSPGSRGLRESVERLQG